MLFRKLFRTAWGYRSQFISMILMIALGMGIFLGFNMEWATIDYDTFQFFDNTHYADYRLYTQEGFTEEDLEKIVSIDGVQEATRFLSVNLDVADSSRSLALDVSEDFNVSTFLVMEGQDYDENADGFWLSDKFAKTNGYAVGDTLTLIFQGSEISGPILGLIKAGEHMICVADSNQLMPDYTTFGYAYMSPEKLRMILKETLLKEIPEEYLTDEMLQEAQTKAYAQVHLLSDMGKEDLEEAVGEALGKTLMVVPKEEHVVYQESRGESEEGKTMGSILPVLFLAIAILTMVTTMHRIATKEKLQIGTLKALGFKNRRILRHYTSYGLMIGLIGSGLGVLIGFWLNHFIMSEDGSMGTYFDMPDWTPVIPKFCYPVMIGTILLLTLISYISVRKQLLGSAADALRPYTPRKMRSIFLEKLPLWDRLHFGTKWNLRDLSRHKSRSLMTLIGVAGCMILLVGGLGMRDTMDGFLDLLDHDIALYTTKINLVEGTDSAEAKALAEELNGDWESLSGISLGGDTITLDILHNPGQLYRLIDEDNQQIDPSDEGVYLCLRLKDRAKIGDTITFSPYGSDDTYTVKVIGYNRSIMTESVTMTDALADQLGLDYSLTSIYTSTPASDIPTSDLIAGKQDKSQLMDTFDSFTEIMDTMVLLLIVAAVILGIVVLYNLGIMGYVERSRELATLKVLGFRSPLIARLLISQNLWLTIVGVAIGLPAGVGVLKWLLTALASEYELDLMLGPLTYGVSILLTFGVSLLVGWMVARKNRHIDMVEALKTED